MGLFNSREIATAVWLLVFVWWSLRKPEIRKSLDDMLRALCHVKIVASVFLILVYVAGLITVLRAVGMWNAALLKDTIVWFFVGAFAMLMRFSTADDTTGLFRRIATDSLKIVIVLEFLVNTYTFPVALELVLVPVLTFIAIIDAVASMNEEHAAVAKLAKGLLTVFGFVILGIAVHRAFADLQTLNSMDTFRSIALAPVLSVCMFPFVHTILVISQYEQLFLRIDFGTEKSPRLRRHIRYRVMMFGGLSLRRLRNLQRRHMVDLMHIGSEEEVDRLLDSARGKGNGERQKEQQPEPDK